MRKILFLSLVVLTIFQTKTLFARPVEEASPPIVEGTGALACDIDPGSLPAISFYASNCFTTDYIIPIECSTYASMYRSYCREEDHESAESCLSRHHCAVPATTSTPPPTTTPNFRVTLRDLQTSAHAGDTVQVPFFVIREGGFSGEVAITLHEAPAGITADAFNMPRDRNEGNLALHLPGTLASQDYQVVLEGTNGSIVRDSVNFTLHVTAATHDDPLLGPNTTPNPTPQNGSSGGGCSMVLAGALPFNSLWVFGMGFVAIFAARIRRK